MADRRRNHFIPRFLLNRFASRRSGKKSWIWQLSKQGDSLEISTKDAAVATDFYGGPSTGVENAFADFESGLSRTLSAIEKGEPLEAHVKALRQLVWSLAVRTRAQRGQFARLADDLTAELVSSASSSQAQDYLVAQLRSTFMDSFEKALAQELPPEGLAAARASFASAEARENLLGEMEALMRTSLPQEFFGQIRKMMMEEDIPRQTAEEGQINGITRLLAERKVPEAFSPSWWKIIRSDSTQLILGDSCVVAVGLGGEVRSLPLSSDVFQWETIYLPISPSEVLVAGRQAAGTLLLPKEINAASAEIAYSHIFCSTADETTVALTRLIGSKAYMLSPEEISNLVSGAWK